MTDNSDSTADDVDHVVDTLLSGSHASDTDEQAEHDSADPPETAANTVGGSREDAENAQPPEPDEISDRVDDLDDMIESVDAAIEQAEYKIDGAGRIRDPEIESIRIRYLKVLNTSLRTKRQILEDLTLQELGQRVQDLEKEVEN